MHFEITIYKLLIWNHTFQFRYFSFAGILELITDLILSNFYLWFRTDLFDTSQFQILPARVKSLALLPRKFWIQPRFRCQGEKKTSSRANKFKVFDDVQRQMTKQISCEIVNSSQQRKRKRKYFRVWTHQSQPHYMQHDMHDQYYKLIQQSFCMYGMNLPVRGTHNVTVKRT